MVVKPAGFNTSSFHQFVTQQTADVAYLSNSVGNAIQNKIPGKDEYYFERFPGRIVFLHQDAILGGASLLNGLSKLHAWHRVAHRSAHLCIEPDNVTDLLSLGIHAKLVPHATEIPPAEPALDGFEHLTTFVGHVVPSMCSQAGLPPNVQGLVGHAIQARKADQRSKLEPLIRTACEAFDGIGDEADQSLLKISAAQWLRTQISLQGMPFRGWVFENANAGPLTIFGGDPAYLHGVERHLRIDHPQIAYAPAVYDPIAVHRIFNRSKVNLNVSSLQFDHAVVNRFHDVVMSGGLCLTDARDGLPDLTPLHEEISYRTMDELRDRIRHFSKPENASQRALLIKAMQRDIARNSGYHLLAQAITTTLAML